MSLKDELRESVQQYVAGTVVREALNLDARERLFVLDLAQGEYNLNYFLKSKDKTFVFRVNTGSQMNLEDQIGYEFRALQLLSPSEVTPKPLYLDSTKKIIHFGLLIMEYLPGRPLDYALDLGGAARTLARIHALTFRQQDIQGLVKEDFPFTAIYREAEQLLKIFWECPRVENSLKEMFRKIMQGAWEAKEKEKYFQQEPWSCLINTEVNSHNFIVNDEKGTTHLVDWEKPIFGEPAQDLSHFLIRTTTLWKRDYKLSPQEEEFFLNTYLHGIPDSPLKASLKERVAMFKPFIHLRAVAWCAMAWVEYTNPGRLLRNEDTFKKIQAYLKPDFLRGLFPFL